MYLKFFIPFLYAFQTRMGGSLVGLLKWIAEYLLPVFVLYVYVSSYRIYSVLVFILGVLLVYNLYEIGYIWNDTITIRKEKSPTLRLSERELEYFYQNPLFVLLFRIVLSVFVSILVYSNPFYSVGIWALIFSWSILIVYYFYNRFRNRFNFVLHFVLLTLRYSCPWFFFSGENDIWMLLLITCIIYPFPIMLEIISKRKFGVRFRFTDRYLPDYSKRHQFRVVYYLCLTCTSVLGWWIFGFDLLFVLLSLYLLFYNCIFNFLQSRILSDGLE